MKRDLNLETAANQNPNAEDSNPPPAKRARTTLAGRDVSTNVPFPPLPLPPSQPSASSPPDVAPPSPTVIQERARALAQEVGFAESFQIEQKLAETLPLFSFNGTARDKQVLRAIISLYKRVETITDEEDPFLFALQDAPQPKEQTTLALLHTMQFGEQHQITGRPIIELFEQIKSLSCLEATIENCRDVFQRREVRGQTLLLALFSGIASLAPEVVHKAHIEDLTVLAQRVVEGGNDTELNEFIEMLNEQNQNFLLTHINYLRRATEEHNLTGKDSFNFLTSFFDIDPTLLEDVKKDFAGLLRIAEDRKLYPGEVATLFTRLSATTIITDEEDAESVRARYKELLRRSMHFLSEKRLSSVKGIRIVVETFGLQDGDASEPLDQLDQMLENFSQLDEGRTRGDDAAVLLAQVSRLETAYEEWKSYVQDKESPNLLLRSALLVLGYGGLTIENLQTVISLLGRENSAERLEAVMAGILPVLKGMPKEHSFETVKQIFQTLSTLPSEQISHNVHRLLRLAQERGIWELSSFNHILRGAPAPAQSGEFNNILDHAERIAHLCKEAETGSNSNKAPAITALLQILAMLPKNSRGEETLITLHRRLQDMVVGETTDFVLTMVTALLPLEQRLHGLQQILREEETLSSETRKSSETLAHALCITMALRSLPSEEEKTRAYIQRRSTTELRSIFITASLTPPFLLRRYFSALIASDEYSQGLIYTLLEEGGEQLKSRLHHWLVESAKHMAEEHPIISPFFISYVNMAAQLLHLEPNHFIIQQLNLLLQAVALPGEDFALPQLPLRVHRELRIWAREPAPLPKEKVGETHLSWNKKKVQEALLGQKKYRREDLPEDVVFQNGGNIFHTVFHSLVTSLMAAYPSNNTPQEEQETLQKMYVFFQNPAIQLLLSPTNPQVSEYTFYLYKLGEELRRKNPDKPPNERFSEQQEWLKVIVEGVQHCEQGVEEGIFQTYQLMQSLRGESSEPADASVQTSANKVRASLEKLCLDYLRTRLHLSEEFIGEVAEMEPHRVAQLPHQRHYLQQLIHPQFGAPLRKDPHTQMVLPQITKKARNPEQRKGIRKLFFEKHLSLSSLFSSIERRINEDINDFSPRKKMFGLTGLIRFFEGKDPNAENVAKYFEEEEAGTYKVRKEAVVEILKRTVAQSAAEQPPKV